MGFAFQCCCPRGNSLSSRILEDQFSSPRPCPCPSVSSPYIFVNNTVAFWNAKGCNPETYLVEQSDVDRWWMYLQNSRYVYTYENTPQLVACPLGWHTRQRIPRDSCIDWCVVLFQQHQQQYCSIGGCVLPLSSVYDRSILQRVL